MLKGKTVVITKASRGIGQAMALKFASAGANIVILSREAPENIRETENFIEAFGRKVWTFPVEMSDIQGMKRAILESVHRFGGIDILVNNAGSTCFTDVLNTSPEEFDAAIASSVRTAFFLSQICFPYLKKGSNPHIINMSPPINIDSGCLKDCLTFSLSKYATSLCTLGMAEEFRQEAVAVNSLWPETAIATPTLKEHFLAKVYAASRWPSIMADAAYELVLKNSKECTGRFFTDEMLLREAGVVDFSQYAVDPSVSLMQSLFLPINRNRISLSRELFHCNCLK